VVAKRIRVETGRGVNATSKALRALNKLIQELPGDMEPKIVRGLRGTAYRGIGVVADRIETTKPRAPIDTGDMKRSVRARDIPGGAVLAVESPHAVFMERGTRPHMPPVAPLAEWARAKGIAATDSEAASVGYAVALKIAREGTEPRWFFRRSMRYIMRSVLPDEIDRELRS